MWELGGCVGVEKGEGAGEGGCYGGLYGGRYQGEMASSSGTPRRKRIAIDSSTFPDPPPKAGRIVSNQLVDYPSSPEPAEEVHLPNPNSARMYV